MIDKMDKHILRYVNENKTELKRQQHYKSQAADLLFGDDTDDFIRQNAQNKYDTACEKIAEFENNIKSEGLKERVKVLLELATRQHKNSLQNEENIQHRRIQEKERKNVVRETYYTNLRKFCKSRRQNRYQMRREERWLRKTENYFPLWKLKKLKNMPNNKGYIWRGIYYYGHKPAIKGEPIFLFEQKGKSLYIHEISKTQHKIFLKENKNSRRKLIEIRQRKNLLKNDFMFT